MTSLENICKGQYAKIAYNMKLCYVSQNSLSTCRYRGEVVAFIEGNHKASYYLCNYRKAENFETAK